MFASLTYYFYPYRHLPYMVCSARPVIISDIPLDVYVLKGCL